MRDTIAGFVILLSVIGGYFAFRAKTGNTDAQNTTLSAPLAQATQISSVESSSKRSKENKISKNVKRITRKAIHERTKHRKSRAHQDDGHYQGSSRQTEQTEKLPSIYEDQEGRVTDKDSAGSTRSVYGVPVNAYSALSKNSLSTKPADPSLAQGVRLFVGCMEIKKEGARELTKGDCAKIAATNQSIR